MFVSRRKGRDVVRVSTFGLQRYALAEKRLLRWVVFVSAACYKLAHNDARRRLLSFACGRKKSANTNADCVAGAERYFDFVCDWGAAAVGGRYEMVLRCRTSGGIAASWGLLAHRVGGGYCGAGANAGDWVGAVQAGDCREIAGAAI